MKQIHIENLYLCKFLYFGVGLTFMVMCVMIPSVHLSQKMIQIICLSCKYRIFVLGFLMCKLNEKLVHCSDLSGSLRAEIINLRHSSKVLLMLSYLSIWSRTWPFLRSRNQHFQSQQWQYHNNKWNLFKINNKDEDVNDVCC